MYSLAKSLSIHCTDDDEPEVDWTFPVTTSFFADSPGQFVGWPSAARWVEIKTSFEPRRSFGSSLPGVDWLLSLGGDKVFKASLFLRLLQKIGGTGTLRCVDTVSLDFEVRNDLPVPGLPVPVYVGFPVSPFLDYHRRVVTATCGVTVPLDFEGGLRNSASESLFEADGLSGR